MKYLGKYRMTTMEKTLRLCGLVVFGSLTIAGVVYVAVYAGILGFATGGNVEALQITDSLGGIPGTFACLTLAFMFSGVCAVFAFMTGESL